MDILIPVAVPSLAISVFTIRANDASYISEMACSINTIQRKQKNYFVFIDNVGSDEEWMRIQFLINSEGCARLLRTTSISETAAWIMDCVEKMCDTDKLKLQSEFFCIASRSIMSPKTARLVATSTFSRLSIPAEEQQLLIEGFPTLKLLISAERQLLEDRSPVDIETIVKVHSFFNLEFPAID